MDAAAATAAATGVVASATGAGAADAAGCTFGPQKVAVMLRGELPEQKVLATLDTKDAGSSAQLDITHDNTCLVFVEKTRVIVVTRQNATDPAADKQVVADLEAKIRVLLPDYNTSKDIAANLKPLLENGEISEYAILEDITRNGNWIKYNSPGVSVLMVNTKDPEVLTFRPNETHKMIFMAAKNDKIPLLVLLERFKTSLPASVGELMEAFYKQRESAKGRFLIVGESNKIFAGVGQTKRLKVADEAKVEAVEEDEEKVVNLAVSQADVDRATDAAVEAGMHSKALMEQAARPENLQDLAAVLKLSQAMADAEKKWHNARTVRDELKKTYAAYVASAPRAAAAATTAAAPPRTTAALAVSTATTAATATATTATSLRTTTIAPTAVPRIVASPLRTATPATASTTLETLDPGLLAYLICEFICHQVDTKTALTATIAAAATTAADVGEYACVNAGSSASSDEHIVSMSAFCYKLWKALCKRPQALASRLDAATHTEYKFVTTRMLQHSALDAKAFAVKNNSEFVLFVDKQAAFVRKLVSYIPDLRTLWLREKNANFDAQEALKARLHTQVVWNCSTQEFGAPAPRDLLFIEKCDKETATLVYDATAAQWVVNPGDASKAVALELDRYIDTMQYYLGPKHATMQDSPYRACVSTSYAQQQQQPPQPAPTARTATTVATNARTAPAATAPARTTAASASTAAAAPARTTAASASTASDKVPAPNAYLAHTHAEAAKLLFEQGVVVCSSTLADLDEKKDMPVLNKRLLEVIRSLPEFKKGALDSGKERAVLGGFGALGVASSFHHPYIRKLREWIGRKVLFGVASEYAGLVNATAPSEKERITNISLVFDRLLYRVPKQKPGAESWHRDLTPTEDIKQLKGSPSATQTILVAGGWFNTDTEAQFLSCKPKSHRLGIGSGVGKYGFTKATVHQDPGFTHKTVRIKIPPGGTLIINQSLLHEVLATTTPKVTTRLFTGMILGNSLYTTPILSDATKNAIKTQGVPIIKSGQMPPMWPKLSWVNQRDALAKWSANVLIPAMSANKVLKSKDGVRLAEVVTYRVALETAPSLGDLNMAYYDYADDEKQLFAPTNTWTFDAPVKREDLLRQDTPADYLLKPPVKSSAMTVMRLLPLSSAASSSASSSASSAASSSAPMRIAKAPRSAQPARVPAAEREEIIIDDSDEEDKSAVMTDDETDIGSDV